MLAPKKSLFCLLTVSFIQVGHVPKTDLAKGLVNMDENGYIKVSEDMKTSEEGIFAAGDVRQGALGQIVDCCS